MLFSAGTASNRPGDPVVLVEANVPGLTGSAFRSWLLPGLDDQALAEHLRCLREPGPLTGIHKRARVFFWKAALTAGGAQAADLSTICPATQGDGMHAW